MLESFPRLRTFLVVLTALLVPVVLAIVFISAVDWSNRPISVAEQRANPDHGLYVSSLSSAFVFLHALAQLAFVVVGAWRIERPRVRVAFLLIAIPVSTFVFLVSFIGLIAK